MTGVEPATNIIGHLANAAYLLLRSVGLLYHILLRSVGLLYHIYICIHTSY